MGDPQYQPQGTPPQMPSEIPSQEGRPQPEYGQYAPPNPPEYNQQQQVAAPYYTQPMEQGAAQQGKTITLKPWQLIVGAIGAILAGMIILIIISVAATSGESASAPAQSETSSTTDGAQSDKSKESNTPAMKTISYITVKYSGPATAGTEINDTADGIDVTVHYSDGSSRAATEFTVKNPGTLESGKSHEFTVECQGHEASFTVQVEETDDEFKASAQDIPFDDLARNPDANMGKRVHFRGKIIQVIEDGNAVQYRVSVQQGDYGIWDSDKVIYVVYSRSGNDNRLLKDDIVELWGTSTGTITYQSTMGGNITIPSVIAKIMQISQ
ncbi:hypothetical protein [Bifidobacterium platyrrhinorum]|uniref:TcdA-E operon negative regulator n=1 Tax=Bifidobacterium platyrrhinorum TaxID=2661628 RepID=A0A6L9STX0_9BIFI|nr:hypothetical protein [Bifidobacterium platyrrhinorum]NEG55233.1 hypothetical protein [Bifidobacterium platyrrhinorum]